MRNINFWVWQNTITVFIKIGVHIHTLSCTHSHTPLLIQSHTEKPFFIHTSFFSSSITTIHLQSIHLQSYHPSTILPSILPSIYNPSFHPTIHLQSFHLSIIITQSSHKQNLWFQTWLASFWKPGFSSNCLDILLLHLLATSRIQWVWVYWWVTTPPLKLFFSSQYLCSLMCKSIWSRRTHSLKYQRSECSDYKDVMIRKSE